MILTCPGFRHLVWFPVWIEHLRITENDYEATRFFASPNFATRSLAVFNKLPPNIRDPHAEVIHNTIGGVFNLLHLAR